jgi:hypothetical protein
MKGASEVIVSRGPWHAQGGRDTFELLWEHGLEASFAIHLVAEQTDCPIPEYQTGRGFVVCAWTRGGMKAQWPGRYREVDAIPCMRPWEVQ